VFSGVRQIEFTLLQLLQQIDYLFNSVQSATLGRLPIKLVNPIELQCILGNVTLHLPQVSELIVGTSMERIDLYYGLNKDSEAANIRCVNLVLTVHLKSTNRRFTLFRVPTVCAVRSLSSTTRRC